MVITKIHLVLQRPATRDEIDSYEYLRRLFDGMTPDERAAHGIRRVNDMASSDDVPGKNVVYDQTSSEPLYNGTVTQEGRLQIGIPGAIEQLKRVVSSMLRRNRRPEHRSYYVLGELETSRTARAVGFRTLIARTAL